MENENKFYKVAYAINQGIKSFDNFNASYTLGDDKIVVEHSNDFRNCDYKVMLIDVPSKQVIDIFPIYIHECIIEDRIKHLATHFEYTFDHFHAAQKSPVAKLAWDIDKYIDDAFAREATDELYEQTFKIEFNKQRLTIPMDASIYDLLTQMLRDYEKDMGGTWCTLENVESPNDSGKQYLVLALHYDDQSPRPDIEVYGLYRDRETAVREINYWHDDQVGAMISDGFYDDIRDDRFDDDSFRFSSETWHTDLIIAELPL